MIELNDIDGFVVELGNGVAMEFVQEVAGNQNLEYLNAMFNIGFTINIKEIMDEIDGIQWPEIDDTNELALKFVGGLSKCKGGLAYFTMAD